MSPASPAGERRRYPLRLRLSALFSALVLATGVAIAWLGYGEAHDLTRKATDEGFRHVGCETRSALAEALKIMSFMRRDQHVDPDLFDLFLTSGVYRAYAERFLRPEQIDAVDVAQYLGRPQAA